jgi:hypothetical protein
MQKSYLQNSLAILSATSNIPALKNLLDFSSAPSANRAGGGG